MVSHKGYAREEGEGGSTGLSDEGGGGSHGRRHLGQQGARVGRTRAPCVAIVVGASGEKQRAALRYIKPSSSPLAPAVVYPTSTNMKILLTLTLAAAASAVQLEGKPFKRQIPADRLRGK